MGQFVDITGRKFGRLTVVRRQDVGDGVLWACSCDCGGQKVLRTARLTGSRPTLSCGCIQRETIRTIRTTHGHAGTYLYRTWTLIIQRCRNVNNPAYPRYGGRGITVCDRWVDSFETFAADVGDRPTAAHTLDRRDNNGNYEPGNVRWATRTEQARNRRSNRLVTIGGKTKPLSAWIEHLGLNPNLVESRLRHGWDVVRALTAPSRRPR